MPTSRFYDLIKDAIYCWLIYDLPKLVSGWLYNNSIITVVEKSFFMATFSSLPRCVPLKHSSLCSKTQFGVCRHTRQASNRILSIASFENNMLMLNASCFTLHKVDTKRKRWSENVLVSLSNCCSSLCQERRERISSSENNMLNKKKTQKQRLLSAQMKVCWYQCSLSRLTVEVVPWDKKSR